MGSMKGRRSCGRRPMLPLGSERTRMEHALGCLLCLEDQASRKNGAMQNQTKVAAYIYISTYSM